jgi:hypothetical protein
MGINVSAGKKRTDWTGCAQPVVECGAVRIR